MNVVRASEPETLDHAVVVAVDGNGSIAGQATPSRRHGLYLTWPTTLVNS